MPSSTTTKVNVSETEALLTPTATPSSSAGQSYGGTDTPDWEVAAEARPAGDFKLFGSLFIDSVPGKRSFSGWLGINVY